MLGCGTLHAIFILRQLRQKHIAKKKNLYFAFVDLEKAFNRMPRDVLWWALRKLGLKEWLVKTLQSMYGNAGSRVRVNGFFSYNFLVQVGSSGLSGRHFSFVKSPTKEMRSECPEELLYETFEGLKERFRGWKRALESKGLRVDVHETKMIISIENAGNVTDECKSPCAVCRKGVSSNSI